MICYPSKRFCRTWGCRHEALLNGYCSCHQYLVIPEPCPGRPWNRPWPHDPYPKPTITYRYEEKPVNAL